MYIVVCSNSITAEVSQIVNCKPILNGKYVSTSGNSPAAIDIISWLHVTLYWSLPCDQLHVHVHV